MTAILYFLIAAFIVYELVAHFVLNNKGMETLSHLIFRLEARFGWWFKIIVAVAVVLLGVHLEGWLG